ncbi:MAG TPA: hypothetical protein VKR32_16335 [Puia sp.]|nr:hypothetical protein [Puia sp.]
MENLVNDFLWNAGAVVPYRHAYPAVSTFHRHGYNGFKSVSQLLFPFNHGIKGVIIQIQERSSNVLSDKPKRGQPLIKMGFYPRVEILFSGNV